MEKRYKIGKIDLSQIECRVLNTLAGQRDVVEKFRAGVDLYSELASRFYGFPVDKSKPAERGTGKQLELSCGYGAGGQTIVRTARAGTYGPPVYLTDVQGLQARDLYRGTHPCVTELWRRAETILWSLRDRRDLSWGPPGQITSCMQVHDHRIFGPGGLWLDFTSLERYKVQEGEQKKYGANVGEEVWRHRVREGYRKTYGGRFIQNICELLARQVASQAMVRIIQLGYRIVLTEHDSAYILISVNVGDPMDHLMKCEAEFKRPVPWLEACPIACESELLEALAK